MNNETPQGEITIDQLAVMINNGFKEARIDLMEVKNVLEKRIEKLEIRVDVFEKRVDEKFEVFEKKVDAKFALFEKKVDAKFTLFEKRVDEKFEVFGRKMDIRFDGVQKQIDTISDKYTPIEKHEHLIGRVKKVERKVGITAFA